MADVMAKYKINVSSLSPQNQLMIYSILANRAPLLAQLLEKYDCDTTLKFLATATRSSISMKYDAYELARQLANKFNDTSCTNIISKHRAKKCELLKSRIAANIRKNKDRSNGDDTGNEFSPPA